MNTIQGTPTDDRESTTPPASTCPPSQGPDPGDSSVPAGSDTDLAKATIVDVPYIRSLQDANRAALGFLSPVALTEYVEHQHVELAYENGDPAAYLLFGTHGSTTRSPRVDNVRIVQACVQYDARRVMHASSLVTALIRRSTAAGLETISCWCADDLEANDFWSAAGFEHVASRHRHRHARRSRLHRQWVYVLPGPTQRRLFDLSLASENPPVPPAADHYPNDLRTNATTRQSRRRHRRDRFHPPLLQKPLVLA